MSRAPVLSREERASRSPEAVARLFHVFGRQEAPLLESPLYAELCYGIASDPALIEIARAAPASQPPPNLLLAAVQYLLLRGVRHPLVAHYPAISGAPRPLEPAFPLFRDFCARHRAELSELVATRLTQTNVVRRSSGLLPAFAAIAAECERPLALLEVGASAGLNLNWDRYHYAFRRSNGAPDLAWGDPASAVRLEAELRGGVPLPALPPALEVAWRCGVDLAPIDVRDPDALLWLRALIWPEHVERHALLAAAAAIARQHPPTVLAGDAVDVLPGLVERAPDGAALVVFATIALYQFPRERLVALHHQLVACARGRPVWLLAMEGTGTGYELVVGRFEGGARSARRLAECHPHAWWLRWLPPDGGASGPRPSPWVRWIGGERA